MLVALSTAMFPVSSQSETQLKAFELADQSNRSRSYAFPRDKVTVMTVADYRGSAQLTPWIQRLHDRYGDQIAIDGIADVSMIPKPFQALFRREFRKRLRYPVMLDWEGAVLEQFDYEKGVANVYVVDRRGAIRMRIAGAVSDGAIRRLFQEIDRNLKRAQ